MFVIKEKRIEKICGVTSIGITSLTEIKEKNWKLIKGIDFWSRNGHTHKFQLMTGLLTVKLRKLILRPSNFLSSAKWTLIQQWFGQNKRMPSPNLAIILCYLCSWRRFGSFFAGTHDSLLKPIKFLVEPRQSDITELRPCRKQSEMQ